MSVLFLHYETLNLLSMANKFNTKKDEYIAILLEGSYDAGDIPYLESLSTDQLKVLVTREDDELVEDPEMTQFNEE